MWFLAKREILHHKIRFGLVAGLIGLVSFLVFVMTGLSTGLGEASVSGLRIVTGEAQAVVYAAESQRALARSDVAVADASKVSAVAGVTAVAPIGQSMATFKTSSGKTLSVALVGVPDDATFFPVDRQPAKGSVLIDSSAAAGLQVGDVVRVQPGGQPLAIGGFSDLGRIQHMPVAYTALATWQRLRYATFDTEDAKVPNRANAFLVTTMAEYNDQTIMAIPLRTELDAARVGEAIAASPGYKEETGTINLIRGFLFGIAALLVGTFFWILTLQKEGSLAVLRAAGAGPRVLIGSHTLQVIITTMVGLAAGLGAAKAVAKVMPTTVYLLTGSDIVVAGLLLLFLALAASASSMRRLFTVDPLLSLGTL